MICKFHWHRCHVLSLIAAIVCGSMVLPRPAHAEYLLGSGDVLEVAVFGVADFKRRVTVNIDGDISVPFLGEVRASGASLAALRHQMTNGLAALWYIRDTDVTIELIEYRPFYIMGDVARPGAYPFRPALTVRHAIALAGGYDALRFRPENPLLLTPELRGQYETLWIDLVRRQARIISLNAQVEGKNAVDFKSLFDAPIASEIVREMADLETKELNIRAATFEKEKQFISNAIISAKKSVTELEQALKRQQENTRAQEQVTQRIEINQAKGISSITLVDQERRGLALLQTQELEISGRLAQTRKEREEIIRKLEKTIDDYRETLLRDLKEGNAELEKVRAQTRGVGEKLVYARAAKAQMRQGGSPPEILVHRSIEGNVVAIAAKEDTELLPGDVVDAIIRPDQLVVKP